MPKQGAAAIPDAVLLDTDAFSILLARRPGIRSLAAHVVGRRVVLAVQTVAELRFGALRAGWGDARREGLEREIARVDVVPVDDRLATVYAGLRDACVRSDHPLGAKHHDGDRWVAASALRHDLPLVTFDGVFADAPGLVVTVVAT